MNISANLTFLRTPHTHTPPPPKTIMSSILTVPPHIAVSSGYFIFTSATKKLKPKNASSETKAIIDFRAIALVTQRFYRVLAQFPAFAEGPCAFSTEKGTRVIL